MAIRTLRRGGGVGKEWLYNYTKVYSLALKIVLQSLRYQHAFKLANSGSQFFNLYHINLSLQFAFGFNL